jgi:preprotein translocase subunit SecA
VLGKAIAGSDGAVDSRISEETLTTARSLSDEFSHYENAKREGGSALPIFFADQLIEAGDLDQRHRTEGVRIARHVLAEEWDEAGQLAQQIEGMGMTTLSHLQRIRERFEGAKNAETYVVQNLSSTYHDLLMSIIRLTLEGDTEAAGRLASQYPELPADLLQTVQEICESCRQDMRSIRASGGLHVIGTERHDARRIDNQLRGRAGRQGDPGSSQFYLSMEDELMRRFGGERVQNMMRQMGMGDVPLEMNILTRTVESAQTRVEGYNFDLRKHVLEYDDVINKQREVIYDQRHLVLTEPDLRDQVLRMVREEISGLVMAYYSPGDYKEPDLKGLHTELRAFVPLPSTASPHSWRGLEAEEIEEQVYQYAELAYDEIGRRLGDQLFQEASQRGETLAKIGSSAESLWKSIHERAMEHGGVSWDDGMAETPLGSLPAEMQELVKQSFVDGLRILRDRQIMLRAVDSLWVRYLTDLAILREGIGLRAFGQQNPLVAFQKEGHEMFQMLMGQIQSQVARRLLLAPATLVARQPRRAVRASRPSAPGQPQRAQPSAPAASGAKPGRNEPCWCGSGKKYKHCHLQQDLASKGAPMSARPPQTPGRRRRRR